MDISGNTILITGGASGIGLALARAFIDAGNEVLVCGRDEAKLRRAEDALPGCRAIRCDLTSEESLRALHAEVAERHPRLNVLVNNAGVQLHHRFLDEPPSMEAIDREITTNFTAHVKLTALLLPLLARQEEAAIVNITSALAFIPKESAPVYCATKAAMHAFSKSLRWQLAPTRVRVLEVIPPLVDTEMSRGREGGKVSPEYVADRVLRGMERDRQELRIGRVKLLFAVNRVLPSVAESMMRRR